jgi:hypothetical protein
MGAVNVDNLVDTQEKRRRAAAAKSIRIMVEPIGIGRARDERSAVLAALDESGAMRDVGLGA